MVVIDIGILIILSDEHPEKQESAIDSTDDGIINFVKEEQLLKVDIPNELTDSEMLILFNKKHLEKQELPNETTDEGTDEGGVPVNYEEAIKYYKMAIENGNTVAMNNYAHMLDEGRGVPVNHEEASKYYKMAREDSDSKDIHMHGKSQSASPDYYNVVVSTSDL